MVGRPSGAVTFLFTDVEGSTRAWEDDPDGTADALETHDRVISAAIKSHRGFVFSTAGDSFSAAFSSPSDALTATVEAQRSLAESACGLRVRMGVHSGEAIERDGQYFGPPLNRTARLMALGHGDQVLVSATTAELVSTARFSFVDLGEHRLSDLAAPVRVYQLVAEGLDRDFPPLRSAVRTDNLPRLGEVFGRAADINRLSELLGERRLVTLTGAGGIGKTTLAISVASQTGDRYLDGTWLVDLTDLPQGSDRTAVAGAVASVDDRFGSVDALAPRRMLLILDNCEHVLDATRSYLTDLQTAAPGVTVLATSREPLGVRDERVVPVTPLSVDKDSDHASAVDLFVTRAEQTGVSLDLDAERETITQICRAVGGLPLAIELAAARTTVMTPDQVLDRLSDRLSLLRGGRAGPEHHRTIEATIAWSYDLLDPDTQRLLRFLSVFEGGFDLDQAETVGGDQAVDRLGDLVRKSLVHRHGDRFGMLETVRQYAANLLQHEDEGDEARRRHFEFFANRAHHIYHRNEFIELDQGERGWITANLANLRATIRWGADNGSPVQAAEIAEILWVHLVLVLYGLPQTDWYEPLLVHLDDLPPQLQLGVLHGAGAIADWMLDDPDRALVLLEAEYEIHADTGLIARSGGTPQDGLGMWATKQGRWEQSIRWFREAADVGPMPLGPTANLVSELWRTDRAARDELLDFIDSARRNARHFRPGQKANLDLTEADIRVRTGETAQPRQLILRSLARLREANIRYDLQYAALSLLSVIERRQGDLDASATLLLEAIDLAVSHGLDPIWGVGEAAIDLSDTLIDLGHPDVASRVVAAFHASNTFALAPRDARELEQLSRRIEQATRSNPGSDQESGNVPFIDAIRQALSRPHTT